MKSGSDLQETADLAADLGGSFGRLGDPREDLQQRALPCAILTQYAHNLAASEFQCDVLQRPDEIAAPALWSRSAAHQLPHRAGRLAHCFGQHIAERQIPFPPYTHRV